jgi:hypothetical protein
MDMNYVRVVLKCAARSMAVTEFNASSLECGNRVRRSSSTARMARGEEEEEEEEDEDEEDSSDSNSRVVCAG